MEKALYQHSEDNINFDVMYTVQFWDRDCLWLLVNSVSGLHVASRISCDDEEDMEQLTT